MKLFKYSFIIISFWSFCGCKKLISTDAPKNQLVTTAVFQDTTSAVAAVINTYALFNNSIDPNYTKLIGLYSDELTYTGANQELMEFFNGRLNTTNSWVLTLWKNFYSIIYQCNDVIEQMNASVSLPEGFVLKLTSEVKFLRSFCYFYLLNVYDKVPLLLSTNVSASLTTHQSDSSVVYKQIIQDLLDVQNNLTSNYRGSGKVRVNSLSASALLARIYLYRKDWVNAERSADIVINSGLYTPLEPPLKVFMANSKETILSFWTTNGFIADATSLIPSSGVPGYVIPVRLYNSFENGDLRKSNWIKSYQSGTTTYYHPYKYRNRSVNTTAPEYLMALRIGEQFLIRAEARFNLGKVTGAGGALDDLNTVRNRAGLLNYNFETNAKVLFAIQQERKVELFCEWGHRFLDLKRYSIVNDTLGYYKSSWMKDTSSRFPIPQNEITYSNALRQNLGY